jgi:hypothetical protein
MQVTGEMRVLVFAQEQELDRRERMFFLFAASALHSGPPDRQMISANTGQYRSP